MLFEFLIVAMLASGAAGGLAGHLSAPPPSLDEKYSHLAIKRIVLGIIVAFTVPLFLSLAQSNLIATIVALPAADKRAPFTELLIFCGFCIVASFSSRSFLETLSAKILSEIAKTKEIAGRAEQKAKKNEESIELMDESLTKNSPEAAQGLARMKPAENVDIENYKKLDDLSLKTLLAASKNTLRTATGIAKDAGTSRSMVSEILDELLKKGLIEVTTSPNTGGRRYRISSVGAAVLSHQSAE